MAQTPQNYDNHARMVFGYHYLLFALIAVDVGWSFKVLLDQPSFGAAVPLLTAVAIGLTAFYGRFFALRVQDRVIRLEMRLRMRELLPAALQPRIGEFTPGQLVALRFASDAELPALAEKVLTQNIRSVRDIKKMIQAWEADHLRA